MNKFNIIITVFVTTCLYGNFFLNEKEGNERKINFNLNEISILKSDEYSRIQSEKSGFTTEEGMPELPTYSLTYHVDPFINYEVSINIISSHFEEDINIYPSQNQINIIKSKIGLCNDCNCS